MREKYHPVAALLIAALAGCGPAAAHAKSHRRHLVHVAPPPPAPLSQDAAELARLAPPAPPSTTRQSYGDAVYARERLGAAITAEERADALDAATFGGTPYPCEPRVAATAAYVCNGAPHVRSYGQGYAFTPSYLSAPQQVGASADAQAAILPPVAGLAWMVDSLRADPHN